MLFSAMGLVVLAAAWPKYAKRQARLELQYHAGQEITRRRVEGTSEARPPGHEGERAPPPAGQLIISLWPICAVLVLVGVASAIMFWRGRRAQIGLARQPPPKGAP
jgi:hypothetical protein